MNVQEIDIEKLKPYWRNPRHNEDTVQAIKVSIERYGYNLPIVVDKNNVIIAGHARYKALNELGVKKVKCIVTDMDESEAREYRIADNKIAELSSWDNDSLKAEMRLIDEADVMKRLGFGEQEMDRLLTEIAAKDAEIKYDDEKIQEVERNLERKFAERNEQVMEDYIEITCPFCGESFAISRKALAITY